MKNTNFARYISNIEIEYAPSSFNTETGVILNPPDEMYISKGWYRMINDKPSPQPGCYVKFLEYQKDDEQKTVTAVYVQIMIPVTKEVYTYSKLRLEWCMFQINKTEQFDVFLDNTFITNEFGVKTPLRRFYDMAQEITSDNELFEEYKLIGQKAIGLTDEQMDEILKKCIIKE